MTPAIYTAVAGDSYPIKRYEIPCFRDEGVFKRPVMEAKRYKVLPQLFWPDHEITIWLDANITTTALPQQLVDEFLGDADIALFRHSYRETVWQEIAALRVDHRMRDPYLQRQMAEQEKRYRAEGLPDDTPLYECNFLIRRNNPHVNGMMNAWWAQICRWQWRDQVSFPYVLWRHPGVIVRAHRFNIREHPLFRYANHY